MANFNAPQKKTWFDLMHKILYDVFFLLLVVLAAALVAEGLIPGFLSSRLSFTKIILAVLAAAAAVVLAERKNSVPASFSEDKKSRLAAGLLIFSAMLMANALLGFAFWQNAVITLGAAAVLYYFYKIFSTPPEN